MRLSQGRLEQLMAYADDELSGTERLEVEVLLSENEDARTFLAELGHLGGMVRAAWQESPQAKAVPTFDIAGDVMKLVAAEPKVAAPPVEKVRSLDDARKKRGSNLRTGGIVVTLFAAAAAVAVLMRSPAETPVAKTTPAAVQVGPGVEVEAVESPGSSVSVFHLPGASELSTSVVVWVEETGDKP